MVSTKNIFMQPPYNNISPENPHALVLLRILMFLHNAKSLIFESTLSFKNSHAHLYFICRTACRKTRLH